VSIVNWDKLGNDTSKQMTQLTCIVYNTLGIPGLGFLAGFVRTS
jgi:hypothetical protein